MKNTHSIEEKATNIAAALTALFFYISGNSHLFLDMSKLEMSYQ